MYSSDKCLPICLLPCADVSRQPLTLEEPFFLPGSKKIVLLINFFFTRTQLRIEVFSDCKFILTSVVILLCSSTHLHILIDNELIFDL